MDHFNYRGDVLYAEDIPIPEIVERFGSPLYIYSRATLERHFRVFDDAFNKHLHQVCYAVKANSNLAILNLLARMGSGFDIVSVGELERVLKAGGSPDKIIFSGIGKTTAEIKRALEVGIACFNIESIHELYRLNDLAKELAVQAPIAFRVNPNIDANTHPYITTGLKNNKFGVTGKRAFEFYQQAKALSNIKIKGIAFHIGSQLLELKPFIDSLSAILSLVDHLTAKGIIIETLDIGGGLGVRYHNETPPSPAEYASAVLSLIDDREIKILLEPGRAIAANAGILITRIEYLKQTPFHAFAVVDAGMNDLLRPSLYQAWHDIDPVIIHHDGEEVCYDIVGPVCESGDFFGKQRMLNIKANDLLAIRSAGAYGFAMSSNYNTRPRVAEVLVDGDQIHLIRRREQLEQLFAHEQIIPA